MKITHLPSADYLERKRKRKSREGRGGRVLTQEGRGEGRRE